MGYFLTTEPENAVPSNSCASPKTHTPDPRVSERGQRFYSPELARWVNRDPIEERGFSVVNDKFLEEGSVARDILEWQFYYSNPIQIHLEYIYINNRSLDRIDYIGLTLPPGVYDTCEYSLKNTGHRRVAGSKWWWPPWLKWECTFSCSAGMQSCECTKRCPSCAELSGAPDFLYPATTTPLPGVLICAPWAFLSTSCIAK